MDVILCMPLNCLLYYLLTFLLIFTFFRTIDKKPIKTLNLKAFRGTSILGLWHHILLSCLCHVFLRKSFCFQRKWQFETIRLTIFSELIQICKSGIPPKYLQSKTLMYAVKPVNNKVFDFALLHQIHTKVYFKRDLQLLHQISDF